MNMDPRAQSVLDRIDVDELVKVALDLGNIDSPTGSEGPVGDYVYEWLTRQGFAAKKVALLPDRPNVIGNPYVKGRKSLVWLNASSFAANAPGTFGDAGYNSLIGPGFFGLDANLTDLPDR